jgi:hypothetical protein
LIFAICSTRKIFDYSCKRWYSKTTKIVLQKISLQTLLSAHSILF